VRLVSAAANSECIRDPIAKELSMQTADWALIVSLISLVVALVSLAWNIWTKFVYPRPAVRVRARVMRVFQVDGPKGPPIVCVDMTNHGPGNVTINHAQIRCRRRRFRRLDWGLLAPMHSLDRPDVIAGPFGGGLPKEIETGKSFALYFPYGHGTWLQEPVVKLGVQDIYGRSYWAPAADVRKLLTRYRRDFRLRDLASWQLGEVNDWVGAA
jgi:hypothetical protein